MTISLKTVMEKLPPEQRARVEKRAAELINHLRQKPIDPQ
jgi:hypothetical protein